MTETEKRLDFIIFSLVVLGLSTIPFVFSRWTPENFIIPKEYAVHIISALALFFLGFKLFLNGFALRTSFLTKPAFLLFGWSFLSLLWNENPECATRELAGIALTLLFFFYILNSCNSRSKILVLLWTITLAGTLSALINVMEAHTWYFRFDPGRLKISYATPELFTPCATAPYGVLMDARKVSTTSYYIPFEPEGWANFQDRGAMLGNKNFISVFEGMVLFIPLGFMFFYQSVLVRTACGFLVFLFLYAVFITADLAAPMGIAGGLVFLAGFILMVAPDRSFFKPLRPVFIAMAIGLIGFGIWSGCTSERSPVRAFLNGLPNYSLKTYPRFVDWWTTSYGLRTSSFKAFCGDGYASLKHVFFIYQGKSYDEETKEILDPGIARYAHNDWLQLAAELGLIGVLFFLYFLWVLVSRAARDINLAFTSPPPEKDVPPPEIPREPFLVMALLGGFVSLIFSSFTEFPFCLPTTQLYAVVFISLAAALLDSGFCTREVPVGKPQTPSVSLILRAVLTPLMIVVALATIRLNMNAWKADSLYVQAEVMMSEGRRERWPEILKNLERAAELDKLPGTTYFMLSKIYERLGRPHEAVLMADYSFKNINLKPLAYAYHSVFQRKAFLAMRFEKNLPKTIELSRTALALTCGADRSIYYALIIDSYLMLNRLNEAYALFRKWAATPHARKSPYFIPEGKGIAFKLLAQGSWKEAYEIAGNFRSDQLAQPLFWHILGFSATRLGNLAEGEGYLRQGLKSDSRSLFLKKDLAVNLAQSGKTEDAIRLFEEILKTGFQPTLPGSTPEERQSPRMPLTLLQEIAAYMRDLKEGNLKTSTMRFMEAFPIPGESREK